MRQKQEEGCASPVPALSRRSPPRTDIVVETNYRVYAYTTSDLRVALLSLFVTVQYRLANLAVGVISRESVRDALTHGITSAQVRPRHHYLATERTLTTHCRSSRSLSRTLTRRCGESTLPPLL